MTRQQVPHVTLVGDRSGEYVVREERPDGTLVLEPDSSVDAILGRLDARAASPDQFAAWVAEHGPLLPPDGEG